MFKYMMLVLLSVNIINGGIYDFLDKAFWTDNDLLELNKIVCENNVYVERCEFQDEVLEGFYIFSNKYFATNVTVEELHFHGLLEDFIKAPMSVKQNVEIVEICHQGLKDLPKGLFDGCGSLKFINLSYNELCNLDGALFNDCVKLQGISVAGNNFLVVDHFAKKLAKHITENSSTKSVIVDEQVGLLKMFGPCKNRLILQNEMIKEFYKQEQRQQHKEEEK